MQMQASGIDQIVLRGDGRLTSKSILIDGIHPRGGLTINDLGIDATQTQNLAGLQITNTAPELTADVLLLSTTIAGADTFNLIHGKANSATKFTVDGQGSITSASTVEY